MNTRLGDRKQIALHGIPIDSLPTTRRPTEKAKLFTRQTRESQTWMQTQLHFKPAFVLLWGTRACFHSFSLCSSLRLHSPGRTNCPFHVGTGRAQQTGKVMKNQGFARARQTLKQFPSFPENYLSSTDSSVHTTFWPMSLYHHYGVYFFSFWISIQNVHSSRHK